MGVRALNDETGGRVGGESTGSDWKKKESLPEGWNRKQ